MKTMRTGAAHRYATVSTRALVATIGKGLCLGLLAAICLHYQTAAADEPAQLSKLIRASSAGAGPAQAVATASFTIATQVVAAHRPMRANFERERASQEARHVADWVVDSGDNRGLPFAVVDKA